MSVEAGNILRENREQQGISIKDASDSLHIRIPYLQALESGRAEIIPSAVQARGFLRIYAEYLGLDAGQMISEWDNPGSTTLSQKPQEESPAAAVPQISPQEPNPVRFQPTPNTSYTQYRSGISDQFQAQQPPAADPSTQIPPAYPSVPAPEAQPETPAAAPEPSDGKKKKDKPKRAPLFRKKKTEEKEEEDPEAAAQNLFNDIGQQLSYRRKFLSLSLEDCESQTLIRSIYLESMENGSFEQLPSFIQARGMLNNYAAFLDLDVDAIMLKLATALQLLSQKKNRRGEGKKHKPVKKAGTLRKFFTPDLFVGIFVIVGIAGIIIYSAITITAYRRNAAQPTPELGISLLDQYLDTTKTPAFLPTESPTAAPSGMQQAFTANEPTAALENEEEFSSNQPVQIFVSANQRALMTVKTDGREVFSGRTIPNNTYPFDAGSLIELTVSNGDAVSVVYNQQNLGRLGKLGEVITINFSPVMAATPTPQFSPTPTVTYEPTYTPQPETPLPTNTPTPYIP